MRLKPNRAAKRAARTKYSSSHLEGRAVNPLNPSVPPKILVASMTLTNIKGMISVTMAKYMPRSLNTGKSRRVQIAPPKIVAKGIVINGDNPK